MDEKEFESLRNEYGKPVREKLLSLLSTAKKVGLTIEDLEQIAWKKFWVIRDNLDPKRSVKSYLRSVAWSMARDAIAKMGMSTERARNWKKITKASEEFSEKFDKKATLEDLASITGLSPDYIRDTLEIANVIFSKPFEGEEEKNGMEIPENKQLGNEGDFCTKDESRLVHEALDRCSMQTQSILRALYWKEAPYEEIGNEIRRSKDQIRQTDLPKAKKEFKEHLGKAGKELEEHYRPRLDLISIDSRRKLKKEGRSLVLVALINKSIHVRIFNASGSVVIDKPQNDLIPGAELESLVTLLNSKPFPDPSKLSPDQKREVIRNAKSTSRYTL